MRLLTALGLLALCAAPVPAAYLVELSGGEEMVVEAYWEEGDQLHLQRGGVDLIYPKGRLVSVKPASDEVLPAAAPSRPDPDAPDSPTERVERDEPADREDLEARQERIEKHLLRVQAERFEAKARGDDEKSVKKLDREFRRTQQRRGDVMREIQATTD